MTSWWVWAAMYVPVCSKSFSSSWAARCEGPRSAIASRLFSLDLCLWWL